MTNKTKKPSEFAVIRDPTIVAGDSVCFEKSFGQTIIHGRLDADHFHPRYDRLFRKLNAAGKIVRLGDVLTEEPIRGVQPEYTPHGNVLVLNSQHIHADKIDIDTCERTTRKLSQRSGGKAIIRPLDVLLNSTGYVTIGRCQTVLDTIEAIVDSHITILRPKSLLDPVYLSVFLNSRLGYLQTERAWTGSSGQVELRLDAIKEFLILVPPAKLQRQIRDKLKAANDARREARRLIDGATGQLERLVLKDV